MRDCCRSTNRLSTRHIMVSDRSMFPKRYGTLSHVVATKIGCYPDSASTISVEAGAPSRNVSRVVLAAEYKYSGARWVNVSKQELRDIRCK